MSVHTLRRVQLLGLCLLVLALLTAFFAAATMLSNHPRQGGEPVKPFVQVAYAADSPESVDIEVRVSGGSTIHLTSPGCANYDGASHNFTVVATAGKFVTNGRFPPNGDWLTLVSSENGTYRISSWSAWHFCAGNGVAEALAQLSLVDPVGANNPQQTIHPEGPTATSTPTRTPTQAPTNTSTPTRPATATPTVTPTPRPQMGTLVSVSIDNQPGVWITDPGCLNFDAGTSHRFYIVEFFGAWVSNGHFEGDIWKNAYSVGPGVFGPSSPWYGAHVCVGSHLAEAFDELSSVDPGAMANPSEFVLPEMLKQNFLPLVN